ncbi:LNS2 domain-containing protein [Balamuthia mandrillaris]
MPVERGKATRQTDEKQKRREVADEKQSNELPSTLFWFSPCLLFLSLSTTMRWKPIVKTKEEGTPVLEALGCAETEHDPTPDWRLGEGKKGRDKDPYCGSWQRLRAFWLKRKDKPEQIGMPPLKACLRAGLSFRRAMTPQLKLRVYRHVRYDYTFTGEEAVDFLSWKMQLDREEAQQVGNLLMRVGIFRHISNECPLSDDRVEYYFFTKAHHHSLGPASKVPNRLNPIVGHLVVERLQVCSLFQDGDDCDKEPKFVLQCDHQMFKSQSLPARREDDQVHRTPLHMMVFWSNAILTVRVECTTRSCLAKIPLNDLKEGGELNQVRVPIHLSQHGYGPSASSFPKREEKREDIRKVLLLELRYKFLLGTTDCGMALPSLPFDIYSLQVEEDKYFAHYNLMKTIGHRPNHRCGTKDIFLVADDKHETETAEATGTFSYGMNYLQNARIELFVQEDVSTEEWKRVGSGKTNKYGKATIPVLPSASSLQRRAGYYPIRMMVAGDLSVAEGAIWVLQRGTQAVVFDIDGTLTTGNIQVVTQTSLNMLHLDFDPALRSGAVQLVRAWAVKGYLPIYLSGRSGSFYRHTRSWLIEHGLPPGLIGQTKGRKPTLPLWYSVGRFKRDYLRDMEKDYMLNIVAHYGNTLTDIKASKALGIPASRTFICGKTGGREGTFDVGNDFNEHVHYVMTHIPDAAVPAPNFWTFY